MNSPQIRRPHNVSAPGCACRAQIPRRQWQRENRSDFGEVVMITHGHTTHDRHNRRSSEYSSWRAMKERCLPEGKQGYEHVRVCDRWLNSFENFLADMGPKPTPHHSIDRIDISGHYHPGNCRWATSAEQAINRRSTLIDGKTVSEVCREIGISKHTFWARRRRGLSIDECLHKPLHQGAGAAPRFGESNSKTNLLESDVKKIRQSARPSKELAAEYGVTRETINNIKSKRTWSHL